MQEIGRGDDVEAVVVEVQAASVARGRPPPIGQPSVDAGQHRRRAIDPHDLGRASVAPSELAQQSAGPGPDVEHTIVATHSRQPECRGERGPLERELPIVGSG